MRLGGEGRFGSYQMDARDHREGVQSPDPLVCEELAGVRRQPFSLHSPCYPPSVTKIAYQGRTFCSR